MVDVLSLGNDACNAAKYPGAKQGDPTTVTSIHHRKQRGEEREDREGEEMVERKEMRKE